MRRCDEHCYFWECRCICDGNATGNATEGLVLELLGVEERQGFATRSGWSIASSISPPISGRDRFYFDLRRLYISHVFRYPG